MGSRNIKETVPEEDRPREKAKKHGFGSLSTAELLAILLRVGTPGESVTTNSTSSHARASITW